MFAGYLIPPSEETMKDSDRIENKVIIPFLKTQGASRTALSVGYRNDCSYRTDSVTQGSYNLVIA